MLYTNHEEILEQLAGPFAGLTNPAGQALELPPRCSVELGVTFLEYDKGKRLKASFPVPEKYSNPAGVLQGGFFGAYFDNVFGPLSYLAAGKPTTTLDLAVNFVRPAPPGKEITIECLVEGRGFQTLHMTGRARDTRGKLLATATTNLYILRPPK